MRVIDTFMQGVARDPSRAAFVDGDRVLTYGEVDARTARLSAGLAAVGAAGGVRAAVLSPNDGAAFVALLGIIRSGGVWLPLNLRNAIATNVAYLAHAECEVLFFHSSVAESARAYREGVPTARLLICIDGPHPDADHDLDELCARSSSVGPDVPDDPERIVIIPSTGGTTGTPKAAMWSQRVFEATVETVERCLPPTGPPVHLVAAPMTHGAGMLALWLTSFGATNIVLPRAEPVAIMEAIERHRVTHVYLPPTVVYMMLAHPDVRSFDFSSLEYLVVAASPIAPEKLREAMTVFNGAVCQSFGQAEAPMFLTFLSSKDLLGADPAALPDRWASCGRATAGTRIGIVDDAGNLLPTGEPGEIVARSDLVMVGYLNNPDATAAVSAGGWHHTGDIGFVDDEGFLYIVDRKKDMIITGGFNVYSAEVEQVLGSHPAVQDCVVVGVPDPTWGEAVKAVVQVRPGSEVAADDLRDAVRARLGAVSTPKTVEFWTDLPRSDNGKVLKAEVRSHFWSGHQRAL